MGQVGPPGPPGPLQAFTGRESDFVGPHGVPGAKGDKVNLVVIYRVIWGRVGRRDSRARSRLPIPVPLTLAAKAIRA
jgi:hypothetical protein